MMRQPPVLDHLIALSDDVGIIQHAFRDVPNRSTGYCTDDVARAFIVALAASEHEPLRGEGTRLAQIYLSFLFDAQLPDGRFHNFMSYDRTWLDPVGTPDSIGRAIWGLGFGMRFAQRESWRIVCAALLERALPRVSDLVHTRARAYAAIGLTHAFEATGRNDAAIAQTIALLADAFHLQYDEAHGEGWDWFENVMTYDNARICEATLRLGTVLDRPQTVALGLRTATFYESIVIQNDIFLPIGNAGWYPRDGARAQYGQQPLEAASMVDLALVAHAVTGDAQYRRTAETALEWFYGRNSRDVVMVKGGGCCDGLEALGANVNMGAESTLAYLASALALAERSAEVLRIAR